MRLFTQARHRALHCDALVIDTARRLRPLVVAAGAPARAIVDAVLERVVLIGRSPHAVRERTFAVFAGRDAAAFTIAVTEPFHDGVTGALRDTLAAFGQVRDGDDRVARDSGLFALLAYQRGRVSFLDGPPTRAWLPLAGRRGLRIAAAAPAHEADPDVYVGDLMLADYLEEPEEITFE